MRITLSIITLFFSHIAFAQSECTEGMVKNGFLTPIVNGFEQCTPASQTCINGTWTGPFIYSTCDNPTEPCDHQPHGTTEFGFLSPIQPCNEGTRTCIDGMWAGPPLYAFCN